MAVYLICPIHRQQYIRGSRCPQCAPDRGRDTAARADQHRFRKAVLFAAGGRCQFIDADTGERCAATTLEACHLDPYNVTGSYDPSRAVALCPRHHRMLDGR
jgi:predicted restriction endonuclease